MGAWRCLAPALASQVRRRAIDRRADEGLARVDERVPVGYLGLLECIDQDGDAFAAAREKVSRIVGARRLDGILQ